MSRVAESSSSLLKRSYGSWAVVGRDKADEFAQSVSSKWSLPGPVINEFSDPSLPIVPGEPG
eukprot:3284017-Pyramimonas_sp.AAC.1